MEPPFSWASAPSTIDTAAFDLPSLAEGPVVVELLIAARPAESALRATVTVKLVVRED